MPNKLILVLDLIAKSFAWLLVLFVVLVLLKHFNVAYLAVNKTPSIAIGIYLVVPSGSAGLNDHVVVRYQGEHFPDAVHLVKHVRAVAGDRIEHQNGQVFINGKATTAVIKSHSMMGDALIAGPVGVVPDDSVFVLGDHPDSFDSRYAYVGFVKKDQIVGRAVRVW